MTNKVKPLSDRVLLRPESERRSEGGIYIPTSSTERGLVMTIEALGEDVKTKFKLGERVLVHKFAGVEVIHEGEKLFLVKEIDILAKIGGGL